jgi:hypothetical protein
MEYIILILKIYSFLESEQIIIIYSLYLIYFNNNNNNNNNIKTLFEHNFSSIY